MPVIIFTQNLKLHTDCPERTVSGTSVSEALQNYFKEYPAVQGYLLDDQNRLRKHMQIAVNGVIIQDRINLTDPVQEMDEIFVVQALSGG